MPILFEISHQIYGQAQTLHCQNVRFFRYFLAKPDDLVPNDTRWYHLVPTTMRLTVVGSIFYAIYMDLYGLMGRFLPPKTHSSIISTCKNNSAFSLYSQHFFPLKSGATKKSTCALPSFLIQKPIQKLFFSEKNDVFLKRDFNSHILLT